MQGFLERGSLLRLLCAEKKTLLKYAKKLNITERCKKKPNTALLGWCVLPHKFVDKKLNVEMESENSSRTLNIYSTFPLLRYLKDCELVILYKHLVRYPTTITTFTNRTKLLGKEERSLVEHSHM